MPLPRMLGLIGGALLACSAFAADAKGADLAELREAVATEDREGENVEAVRKALTDLEKPMAQGAVKPDAAPPELPALREAVEMATRKGENVEAIAKELGRVEKALTGREYERPRPVEPKPATEPQRFPPVRPRPNFGAAGGGIVIGPVNGFNSRSITISNG